MNCRTISKKDTAVFEKAVYYVFWKNICGVINTIVQNILILLKRIVRMFL